MLVENTREETLKAFLNGNEGIMAAVKMVDGGMRFVHISDLLPDDAVYFINMELGPADDYEEKIHQHCQGGRRKRRPLQRIRSQAKLRNR